MERIELEDRAVRTTVALALSVSRFHLGGDCWTAYRAPSWTETPFCSTCIRTKPSGRLVYTYSGFFCVIRAGLSRSSATSQLSPNFSRDVVGLPVRRQSVVSAVEERGYNEGRQDFHRGLTNAKSEAGLLRAELAEVKVRPVRPWSQTHVQRVLVGVPCMEGRGGGGRGGSWEISQINKRTTRFGEVL